MPAQGLAHYNIRVDRAQMEVLRAFYTDVVGLLPVFFSSPAETGATP